MSWYRTAFGGHYRLLYRHRDEAEADRCIASLRRLAGFGAGPVLDLGCGAGRHLPRLAEQVPLVVGLDLSPALLARARGYQADPGSGIALLRADMRALPLQPGTVTAVFSLFTTFGYFGDLAAHAPVVAGIASVLRRGGHWFLDYLNCEVVRQELAGGNATPRHREIPPLRVMETPRLTPDASGVAKAVEVAPLPGAEAEAEALGVPAGGLYYDEEVALFTLPEMDALAAGAGLQRVAAAGGYGGEPLDPAGSSRWVLVYRRELDPGVAPAPFPEER